VTQVNPEGGLLRSKVGGPRLVYLGKRRSFGVGEKGFTGRERPHVAAAISVRS